MELHNKIVKRGRGRPQARPDEETRHLIHEAARHEFLESGYGATCMEAVAARAGVSTKTLYRLIPTKAALFEEMVSARLDQFFASTVADVVDSPDLASALETMLIDCAGLTLDPEVVGLHRLVIAEFRSPARACAGLLQERRPARSGRTGGMARHAVQAGQDQIGGSEGRRRHALGNDDLRTPACGDAAARQAAVGEGRARAGSHLRATVPEGMCPVNDASSATKPVHPTAQSAAVLYLGLIHIAISGVLLRMSLRAM